jgi:hypothetical protein
MLQCRYSSRNSVTEANPNVSGKDSTSSTTSTGSEGSTSGSEGSEMEGTLDDSCEENNSTAGAKEPGTVSLKVSEAEIMKILIYVDFNIFYCLFLLKIV